MKQLQLTIDTMIRLEISHGPLNAHWSLRHRT